MMENELLDERARDLLRWRSRRGLVENDIFVEQFFRTYGASLNVRQAQGLTTLMNLSDNDLLDLMLRRKEPTGDLDTPDVHEVLEMLRSRKPRASLAD
ncbi:MAG: succinate dehydrogenase assembly factor 2 [Comamonas sp.]|jgi:antitoxin CptB|uniref:FAD assembly factor SdhE n=2 Tax=Comamonas TaxID=283 RepID=A0AAW4XVT7_9BURK|nr:MULTISPECIES: succinate dehydrogenase assembly factor 2 [Comamonas]MCD2165639.1 succinate dehydrogenase assembly factor 2 [Comamonas koreensis]MDR2330470.1 succinate dehydrogenase assembly factor 2 [Comamonas sp.]